MKCDKGCKLESNLHAIVRVSATCTGTTARWEECIFKELDHDVMRSLATLLSYIVTAQRYVAHIAPSICIHYHQEEDTGAGGWNGNPVTSIQKEKAYLHISALLDPALFHPVPLCRLPPLLSPWQHFSAICLHGKPLSSSFSSPQFLLRALFLYKNKIKKQSVHTSLSSASRRLLCSATEVRRQVDLCLPPSLVLPLTLTLFHSHHTKANPLFLLLHLSLA